MPGQHFLPEWLDRGDVLRILASGLAVLAERRIVGHRARRIQPAPLSGNAPNIGNRVAPHPLGAGHLAVLLAQPQALNDLSYFVHLEPPVSHCVCPRQNAGGYAIGSPKPTFLSFCVALLRREFTGRITPRIGWPHCAANRVASLCRESNGLIWPRINTCSTFRTATAIFRLIRRVS